MINILKNKFKYNLEKLPVEVQNVVRDFDIEKILTEIGKENLLDNVEINILQEEINFIIIGDKDKEMLALYIEGNIGTSKNEALKIAEEIDIKIFKPMVEKISLSKTKDIHVAIEKQSYSSIIYELGRKYDLLIDQVGVLEEIVNKVISGSLASGKFKDELESKISLPPDKLLNLIEDINASIFKNIRDGLKKDWEEKTHIVNNKNEKIVKEEVIVPLPPYKNNTSKNTPLIDKEMEGIDLEYDSQVLKDHGIDIIEDKLAGSTASEHTVSDYSIPKMSNEGVPTNKNKDPYRESF